MNKTQKINAENVTEKHIHKILKELLSVKYRTHVGENK